MRRGKKQSEYMCGFTMVILFADHEYVNLKNLKFYNEDLVDTIRWMQVKEEWFKNKKERTRRLFTKS